jgi:hypothetical protein
LKMPFVTCATGLWSANIVFNMISLYSVYMDMLWEISCWKISCNQTKSDLDQSMIIVFVKILESHRNATVLFIVVPVENIIMHDSSFIKLNNPL